MGCPVVQFEIGCRDVERAGAFYAALFGWKVAEAQVTTAMLDTDSGAGIPGALTALGHEPHRYVNFYVEVPDVDLCAAEVRRLGGNIQVGPLAIPGSGPFSRFAWFVDLDGNTLGLLQRKAQG